MRFQSDFALYDSDGRLVGLVEAKARFGRSAEWATQLRRNLIVDAGLKPTPFFLLVTPDHVYPWQDAGPQPGVPPTLTIDARPMLTPCAPSGALQADSIDPLTFEMIVGRWLQDLSFPDDDGTRVRTVPPELADSGLLDRINCGGVVYKEAA